MKWTKLGACAAAMSVLAAGVAQARGVASSCASASEVSAIQVAAVAQELTDAALACGPKEEALYNQFQGVFGKELRKSDATMKRMFKRMTGSESAYDAFKTRAIAHAEQRRTKPGPMPISAAPPMWSSPRPWLPTSRYWRISSPVCR